MKQKELKKLASQIAELETIIQNSDNKYDVEEAKEKILILSKKISFQDLDILDEMIMDILTKK